MLRRAFASRPCKHGIGNFIRTRESIGPVVVFYGYIVALAVVQFLFGLAVGVCWARRNSARQEDPQVRSLVTQLQDLATGMAHDMGSFRRNLEGSTKKLATARSEGAGKDGKSLADVVLSVVSEVMQHNADLLHKLEAAEKQLKEQADQMEAYVSEARTDALTGLANRRAFDEELGRRHAQWQRRRSSLSVILFDADRFKLLNDRFGHSAGDYVLKQIAKVVQKALRGMDLLARYGGEEFAVILPETDLSQGRIAAERIRSAVEDFEFVYQGERLPVTVSVGLAELMIGEDYVTVVDRSDAAMYAAKHDGRNRSYLHSGRECILIGAGKKPAAPAGDAPPQPSGVHPVVRPAAASAPRAAMTPVSVELAEAVEDLRQHVVAVAGTDEPVAEAGSALQA
jgi:diguanylate cyclase